jgi:hypothetical protein
MTSHPDLLCRFIPTPYVVNATIGRKDIRIESNDLSITFRLRRRAFDRKECEIPVVRLKLIRDKSIRGQWKDSLILESGSLRTVVCDSGPMLIHDHDRSELFGFLASMDDIEKLLNMLFHR